MPPFVVMIGVTPRRTGQPERTESNSMDLETGLRIGDFRIEKRIAHGATGVVYRARQISLDRVVALKVLGNPLVGGREIARLQREARAVARLDHPGIATVYYVGQDQHTCYMAMEFVEGVPLDRLIAALAAIDEPDLTIDSVIQQTPLEEGPAMALRFDGPADYPDGELEVGPAKSSPGSRSDDALRLIVSRRCIRRCSEMICDVAEALAHAHQNGVVHRDLKPANLIIDPEGRAHLIDFGIARFFEDTTVTKTGAVVGTPMYLAPSCSPDASRPTISPISTRSACSSMSCSLSSHRSRRRRGRASCARFSPSN